MATLSAKMTLENGEEYTARNFTGLHLEDGVASLSDGLVVARHVLKPGTKVHVTYDRFEVRQIADVEWRIYDNKEKTMSAGWFMTESLCAIYTKRANQEWEEAKRDAKNTRKARR